MKITKLHDDQFRKCAKKCGCSEKGHSWALFASDPYHHTEISAVSMPDDNPVRTVVFDVRKQMTLKSPFGAGVEFDAHVAFVPMEGANTTATYDNQGQLYNEVGSEANALVNRVASVNPVPIRALVVCYAPSGTPTFNPSAAAGDNVYEYLDLSEYFSSSTQRARLVGGAFKVQNTTAPLYKQGAVTVYRKDGDMKTWQVPTGTAGNYPASNVNLTYTVIDLPPSTVDHAKLCNGVTLPAEDGALVPIVINAEHNPLEYATIGAKLALTTQINVGDGNRRVYCDPVGTNNTLPPAQHMHAMQSGAYFSGLTEQSVLTLTARLGIEVEATPLNNLISLASESAPADPSALKLYAQIAYHQMPGYSATDNGIGDFFRQILGTAEKVARDVVLPISNVLKDAHIPVVSQVANEVHDVASLGLQTAGLVKKLGKRSKAATKKIARATKR